MVLGQHIVMLNSVKAAMDMLDDKSTVHSTHSVLPVGGEFIGWKIVMTLPHGDRLRRHHCVYINPIDYYSDVQFFSSVGIHLTETSLITRRNVTGVFDTSKAVENIIEITT
ncbi:hypothetical protein BDR04DRAFT_1097516 [Suillus decipiens]|nr:hypothetical protein BDR04DRAFT_1097516 [Suillus decipiens]